MLETWEALSCDQALQQQHNTESSQLKSDILGLRKELKAAKAAPASLEKERDGLRKDLEKLKTKLGDIESKLKLTLIEKGKVEVGDFHYLVHSVWDVGNARALRGLSATVLYFIK